MNAPEQESEKKSKSQQKREAEALQELGVQLAELTPAQRARIPMSDRLREAIEQVRAIRSRGALRRQRQFIGRLMLDEDAAAIRAELERVLSPQREAVKRFHAAERWRDRLLEEGESAVEALLDTCPAAERARLRQLVRNIRQAPDEPSKTRQARALFRYLRDIVGK